MAAVGGWSDVSGWWEGEVEEDGGEEVAIRSSWVMRAGSCEVGLPRWAEVVEVWVEGVEKEEVDEEEEMK